MKSRSTLAQNRISHFLIGFTVYHLKYFRFIKKFTIAKKKWKSVRSYRSIRYILVSNEIDSFAFDCVNKKQIEIEIRSILQLKEDEPYCKFKLESQDFSNIEFGKIISKTPFRNSLLKNGRSQSILTLIEYVRPNLIIELGVKEGKTTLSICNLVAGCDTYRQEEFRLFAVDINPYAGWIRPSKLHRQFLCNNTTQGLKEIFDNDTREQDRVLVISDAVNSREIGEEEVRLCLDSRAREVWYVQNSDWSNAIEQSIQLGKVKEIHELDSSSDYEERRGIFFARIK